MGEIIVVDTGVWMFEGRGGGGGDGGDFCKRAALLSVFEGALELLHQANVTRLGHVTGAASVIQTT